MKIISFFITALFIANVSHSQADSRIFLRGHLVGINSRYHYNDYSREFSTVVFPNLYYMRSINKSANLFAGGGLGYRKILFNEPNTVSNIDQVTSASFIVPGAFVRKENNFGRRSKAVIELGACFNLGVRSKTVDYIGAVVDSYKLVNSSSLRGFFGYLLDIDDKWKLEVGVSLLEDLSPSMSFSKRKIRLKETALVFGISYNL